MQSVTTQMLFVLIPRWYEKIIPGSMGRNRPILPRRAKRVCQIYPQNLASGFALVLITARMEVKPDHNPGEDLQGRYGGSGWSL